jgi:DNA-binding transcriptional ArsR family regulator
LTERRIRARPEDERAASTEHAVVSAVPSPQQLDGRPRLKPPALGHPLTDELVGMIADRFKALADPTRIRLLDRLHESEATVTELSEVSGTTPQNVSKQMLLLLHAGLVARRRDGNFIRYRIADDAVFDLCATVCGSLRHEAETLAAAVGQ